MTNKDLKIAIYLSPLTQRQVAELIGTSKQYLSRMLNGTTPISDKWANKILNVLPHESDGANNGEKA